MSNDSVNISMLLETRSLRPHVRVSLEKMLKETDVEIDYLFINDTKDANDEVTEDMSLQIGTNDVKLLWEYISDRRFSLLWKGESKLAGLLGDKYVREFSKSWGRKSIADLLGVAGAKQIEYNPISIEGDIGYKMPHHVIDKASESDIIINWDRSIWRGEILDAAEYGVWSFHAGDIRKYRGRPAGFFQFLNNEEEIGVTLQQLTPELDGGKAIIINTTDISDCRTFSQIKIRQDRLFEPLLKQGIEQIQQDRFKPYEPDELGMLTKESDGDRLGNAIHALVKNIKGRVSRHMTKVQFSDQI